MFGGRAALAFELVSEIADVAAGEGEGQGRSIKCDVAEVAIERSPGRARGAPHCRAHIGKAAFRNQGTVEPECVALARKQIAEDCFGGGGDSRDGLDCAWRGLKPQYGAAREAEKIAEQRVAVFGADGFRMKLDAPDGPCDVTQRHHHAVGSPSDFLEFRRQRLADD